MSSVIFKYIRKVKFMRGYKNKISEQLEFKEDYKGMD